MNDTLTKILVEGGSVTAIGGLLFFYIYRLGQKMELGFGKSGRKMESHFTALDNKMTIGFLQVNAEFIKIRSEMTESRSEMKEGFLKVDTEFVRIRSEIKDLRFEVIMVTSNHENRIKNLEE